LSVLRCPNLQNGGGSPPIHFRHAQRAARFRNRSRARHSRPPL